MFILTNEVSLSSWHLGSYFKTLISTFLAIQEQTPKPVRNPTEEYRTVYKFEVCVGEVSCRLGDSVKYTITSIIMKQAC